MKLSTFTIERLKRMPRPPSYLDECRACAVEQTETTITLDEDSDCYKALWTKYRTAPVVAPAEPPPAPVRSGSRNPRGGCGCGRGR